jgi:glycosyltransferase involved in cell wall biosynthesis
MHAVITKVTDKMGPEVTFHIVTDKEHCPLFAGLKNTLVFDSIDEEKLRTLYRASDLVVLPLLDCTANNTLLEGLSCGVPVITSDVGSVRDYADTTCAVFTEPGDADSMVAELMALLNNDTLRERMSIAARQRALQFDWKHVAQKMQAIYAGLFH